MKTYLASSETDGVIFNHDYEAEGPDEAQRIADKMGWDLIACVGRAELPADTAAMLEKAISCPTIH